MNKETLVKTIAEKANVNINIAKKCLNAFIETVKETARKKEEIRIVGFGRFAIVEKKERKGKNPKTGEEIIIPAKKIVKFYPSKDLNP